MPTRITFLSLFTLSIAFINPLIGQSLVNFTPPDTIVVCQQGVYFLELESATQDLEVTLEMPVGFEYEAGNILVGEEINSADPTRPEFRMQAQGNDRFTLSFSLTPDCGVYDLLNQGQAFRMVVIANGQRIELPLLEVETPFLVNGSLPRLLLRSGQPRTLAVTVKNTRQGYLTEAYLEVGLRTAFEHTALDPAWTMIDDSTYALNVDGSILSRFGNGDDIWDPDEELNFDFEVFFTGCLERIENYPIFFRSEWGCDTLCQQDLETSVISLDAGTTADPVITMRVDTVWEPCFCNEAPSEVCVTIVNTSANPAQDIEYFFVGSNAEPPWLTSVDTSSIRFTPASAATGTLVTNELPGFEDIEGKPYSIKLYIPYLAAGDSLSWCMDVYPQNIATEIIFTGFANRLTYRSTCPPFKPSGIPQYDVEGPVLGVTTNTLITVSGGIFNEGDEAQGSIVIEDLNQNYNGGILDVELVLPCGMNVLDDSFLLNGREPVSKSGGGDTWQLSYEGPFPDPVMTIPFTVGLSCDVLLECLEEGSCFPVWDSPVKECPENIPQITATYCTLVSHIPCSKGVSGSMCGPFSESSGSIQFECDSLPMCPDTVDKYFVGDLTFERLTLGLVDADNDRIADRREKADPTAAYRDSMRLDRIVSGDTFAVRFDGQFYSENGGADTLEWLVSIAPGGNLPMGDFPSIINSLGFINDVNLQIADGTIRCEDPGGQQLFEIGLPLTGDNFTPNFPEGACGSITIGTMPPAGGGTFTFKIGKTWFEENGLSGFRFENGYKITLTLTLHQDFNPVVPRLPMGFQEIINFTFSDQVFTGDSEKFIDYSAGCRKAEFQLLHTSVFAGAESKWQDSCQLGNTARMALFQMNEALNNAFPYEYRNFYFPRSLIMPRLFNVAIQRAEWKLKHREGFREIEFESFTAFFTYFPDFILFTFPQLDSLQWDENVILLLDMDYDLEFCLPSDSIKKKTWDALASIPDGHFIWKNRDDSLYVDPVDWELPINIQGVQAEFEWQIGNTLATPESDTAEWVYDLIYEELVEGMVLGFELSNDLFEWVSMEDEGIAIGDIIDPQTLSYSTDIFNDTLAGHIRLKQLTCDPDSVWLKYGWRCPFNEDFCIVDSIQLFSRPQGVEFEMQVTGPQDEVDLCEDYDFHEIWFYNADRGGALNPVIEATMPPGLEYIPGSSEFRIYGQANWVSGPDPTGTVDLLTWELRDLLDNGLLTSVDKAPRNEIRLRFRTRPVCGFVSGDQITLRGRGFNFCGEIANEITRFGPELNVNTNIPPRNISLEWMAPDTAYICRENYTMSWVHDFPDGSTANDSLWIYLPDGVTPDAASATWQPGGQALFTIDTLNGRIRLAFGVPAGENQLTLTMGVAISPMLACGEISVQAQAVSSTQIQCGTEPDLCPVYQVAASENSRVVIAQEEIMLADGELLRTGSGELEALFRIVKMPGAPPLELTGCLVIDNPPTGVFGPGDERRYEFGIPAGSWSGDTLSYSVTVPDSVKNAGCRLALVVKAENNCICEDQILPLTTVDMVMQSDTLCPGSLWSIGVDSLPNLSYNWNNGNLGCTDCAGQELVADPGVPVRREILEVVDGEGCLTVYEYELITRPALPQLPKDTLVCVGQSYAFFTPQGTVGEWSGPGVVDPFAAIQVLDFDSDATLVFTGMRADGCALTDSIRVQVIEPPMVEIGPEYAFCRGEERVIVANTEGSIARYQWLPVNAFENSEVNPARLRAGQDPMSVTVFVTDSAGCSTSDTAVLRYSDFEFSADTLNFRVCEGDSLLLEAESAASYRWETATGLSCDTCREVSWLPWDMGELILIGEDSFGCADTIVHTARLIPDVLITTPLMFCEGDTIRIEDTLVTSSGQYFFNFTSAEGCDSIRIYDVMTFSVDTPMIEGPDNVLLGDTVTWRVVANGEFEWSGPFGYIDCGDCPEINFTVTDSGFITLRYRTLDGCELVIRKKINYYEIECPDADNVFVPNAFSPNGDGMNDVLMVRGVLDAELFFVVYNRWGQEVFRTNDPNLGWDGIFDGKLLRPDTYSYYLELRCPGGEVIQKKGNVTIFK